MSTQGGPVTEDAGLWVREDVRVSAPPIIVIGPPNCHVMDVAAH